MTDSPSIDAESSEPTDVELIEELLVEQLREILHAEKQIEKAIPKMAKVADSAAIAAIVRDASGGDPSQIERLEDCSGLLDIQPRAKAWRA